MASRFLRQLLSVIGALLILAAFVSNQVGLWRPDTLTYQALNLTGSTLLTSIAIVESQPGFALLQGAWALISVVALFRLAMRIGN